MNLCMNQFFFFVFFCFFLFFFLRQNYVVLWAFDVNASSDCLYECVLVNWLPPSFLRHPIIETSHCTFGMA